MEDEISHAEERITEAKQRNAQNDLLRGQTETLQRKAQMLEKNLGNLTAKLKDADDKYDLPYFVNTEMSCVG